MNLMLRPQSLEVCELVELQPIMALNILLCGLCCVRVT